MKNRAKKSYNLVFVMCTLALIVTACDNGGDNNNTEPTGSLTATVGGVAYSAENISILTNNGFTVSTTSSDGRRLDLTFLEVNAPGPYPFINRGLMSGPGIAGGFSGNGETYNIDSGSVSVTEFSDSRIAGTFIGTANGLLGAPDLPVADGVFDIQF